MDYRDLLQKYCDKVGYSAIKISQLLADRDVAFTSTEIEDWIWKKETDILNAYNIVLEILGAQAILIHKDGYIKGGVIMNQDGTSLRPQAVLNSEDPEAIKQYVAKKNWSVQQRVDFYLEIVEDKKASPQQKMKAMEIVNTLSGDLKTKESVNANKNAGKNGFSASNKKAPNKRKTTILSQSYDALQGSF